ncbi:DUF6233 domain-containing protein [Streptomyces sp. NBC_00249]|uniref:DUF6233 domain-containing protein n=1 Tax=Streptomyces sp. NBC_00249 TaxID=2975690 RepID=UPI00224CC38E|nr:DUF6233 domain-containing protein [Streptomyces sp. NBC_00249]MCX5195748.1 DUF6233 domain-containing protein [Streptomyces sp. NBC_00249]
MSVLPPDPPRLQTSITYLRGELNRAEAALATVEERETATARKPAPPQEPPAWLVERGIGAGRLPTQLHTGDCWNTGKRCAPASPEQIRRHLTEGVPGLHPLPPRHRPRSARMTGYRQVEG